jgi:uncharacterized protein (DUF302 family)
LPDATGRCPRGTAQSVAGIAAYALLSFKEVSAPSMSAKLVACLATVDFMDRRKIEIERMSVRSSRPFEAVVATLMAAIGHPDMSKLEKVIQGDAPFAELEAAVRGSLGKTGLMLFMRLDAGVVLRKESGRDAPKIMRFLIGNPLIMKDMAKHVVDAASYAPVTVLVYEQSDGVHLSYDTIASLLKPYANAEALAIARDLDTKIEGLLREAAGS